MLAGAMAELRVGAPEELATDVGPVIDARGACQPRRATCSGWSARRGCWRARRCRRSFARARTSRRWRSRSTRIEALREEVFGPVLHVVRWSGDVDALVARINALGYGLTLGIQTRIDSRALRIAEHAAVGNVYVNRNMIGAVVGVQPFGGEGLSGTGPKAGGPHYLYRFCAEQTLTINTAAAAATRRCSRAECRGTSG